MSACRLARAVLPAHRPCLLAPFFRHPRRLHTMAAASAAAAPVLPPRAAAVLDYWLGAGWPSGGPSYFPTELFKIWFKGGPEVDKEITERFGADCEALARGDYDAWQHQPLSGLAGIIIADQLTRNVFRDSAAMYKNDGRGLAWAKALVASGADQSLIPLQRIWVYMPYMHSEALADQEECVRLFQQLAEEAAKLEGCEAVAKTVESNVNYAKLHRDIVAKWGRFPHRNALLGRASTPEEVAGLAEGSILRF